MIEIQYELLADPFWKMTFCRWRTVRHGAFQTTINSMYTSARAYGEGIMVRIDVPGMFLSQPFLQEVPLQKVASRAVDDLFQPGRRASQTRAQVRMLLHRKRELKLPFKPDRRSTHHGFPF
jgi:hypothetical protein